MDIINEVESRCHYKDFYIGYNNTTKTLYASHHNEDLYTDDIIIDLPFKDPVELFDGFILDQKELDEVTKLIDLLI